MGLKKNSDTEKAQEKSQSDDPDKEKQAPSLNAEDLEKERLRQLELQRKLDIQYGILINLLRGIFRPFRGKHERLLDFSIK